MCVCGGGGGGGGGLLSPVDIKPLQTAWMQIRPDKTSGMTWIQTVSHSDGISDYVFKLGSGPSSHGRN